MLKTKTEVLGFQGVEAPETTSSARLGFRVRALTQKTATGGKALRQGVVEPLLLRDVELKVFGLQGFLGISGFEASRCRDLVRGLQGFA